MVTRPYSGRGKGTQDDVACCRGGGKEGSRDESRGGGGGSGGGGGGGGGGTGDCGGRNGGVLVPRPHEGVIGHMGHASGRSSHDASGLAIIKRTHSAATADGIVRAKRGGGLDGC